MTAVAPVTSIVQYLDASGNPLSAGTVDVYLAGTTTRSTTWADQAQGTPNANPVVLDSRGQASIWLDPTITYDFSVKDSTGTLQKTYQNVQAAEFATWVSDQNANSHKITNLAAPVADTDAARLLDAKGTFTLAASGYQKLASGLIVQWAPFTMATIGSARGNTSVNVTFPLAFTTAGYAAFASFTNFGASTTWDGFSYTVSALSTTAVAVTVYYPANTPSGNPTGYVFAIGK